MKRIYFLTAQGPNPDDVPTLFASLDEAIIHAKSVEAPNISRVYMTNDAIIRLHNGGGGYIEFEEEVWINPDL